MCAASASSVLFSSGRPNNTNNNNSNNNSSNDRLRSTAATGGDVAPDGTPLQHHQQPQISTSSHFPEKTQRLSLSDKVSFPSHMPVPSFLSDNPYFSAGFGLAVLGAGAAGARRIGQLLYSWGRRRLLTSLEIPVRDPSYPWVLQWLVARGKLTNHLGVSTAYCKDKAGNVTAKFNFLPSPGRHVLRYKDALLIVERTRSGDIVDMQTGTPWEALTLQTLALQRHVIHDLLEEARVAALAREQGKTVIYHSVGSEWRKYGEPKTIRPFSSVVLAEGVAEQVYKDAATFLGSAPWYLERGIPYRRGYLLHGPPGCGKSSFVMALAGRLRYNICVLNAGDPLMTDDRLQFLLATVPPQTLLLLEDIDGAIRKAEIRAATTAAGGASNSRSSEWLAATTGANPYGMRGVTFSGLLNALDGVVATEERITFMTTNHPERLPDSLIRPGRVDIKVRIGYATPSQLRRQFLRFFPKDEASAEIFVETLRDVQLSMAELQGFFQFCRDNVSQALTMATAWRKADAEARHAALRERSAAPVAASASSGGASQTSSSSPTKAAAVRCESAAFAAASATSTAAAVAATSTVNNTLAKVPTSDANFRGPSAVLGAGPAFARAPTCAEAATVAHAASAL